MDDVVEKAVCAAIMRFVSDNLDEAERLSALQFISNRSDQIARAAIAAYEAEQWRPISEAPVNTPVRVKVGDGMTFIARLVPDGSMNSDEELCDQWQAEREGEHPPCWHDGCCWSSNADDLPSLQPTAFRPLPPAPVGEG